MLSSLKQLTSCGDDEVGADFDGSLVEAESMSNETFAAKEGEVEVADSFVSLNWPHWSVLSERFKLSELPISMLAPTTDSGESKELADLAFPMALVAGSSMVRGIVKLPFSSDFKAVNAYSCCESPTTGLMTTIRQSSIVSHKIQLKNVPMWSSHNSSTAADVTLKTFGSTITSLPNALPLKDSSVFERFLRLKSRVINGIKNASRIFVAHR